MKIRSVDAYWVHIPIPPEKQHTSDFGRTISFDATLVRIDTECGITGWGEAKAQVGSMVARLLRLKEAPKPADAADGVAVALAHILRS